MGPIWLEYLDPKLEVHIRTTSSIWSCLFEVLWDILYKSLGNVIHKDNIYEVQVYESPPSLQYKMQKKISYFFCSQSCTTWLWVLPWQKVKMSNISHLWGPWKETFPQVNTPDSLSAIECAFWSLISSKPIWYI